MPSVLNDHSNIFLRCPFVTFADMLRRLGVNDIYWMVANCAALLPSVDIASQTRAVGPDWIARVVCPDGIINADGVFGMPCGIKPLLCDSSAALWIVVWLVFVANGSWRDSSDEVAVYGIV